MRYSDYKCFRFRFDSGVAFVSIDHPPINLLDEVLSEEFDKLDGGLETDESVRVVKASWRWIIYRDFLQDNPATAP
jgi:hypothetical protein